MSVRPDVRRTPAVLALAGLLLAGCGGSPDAGPGDETGAGDTVSTADTAPAPPAAPSTDPVTDVREVAWAPELGVSLEEMERRPSGLYVQVLAEGSGPPAAPGDSMGVHYTVWLPDGSTLDASRAHQPPEPLPMVLGETQLIDGWVEGVTGMRLGERRRLVLPYDLAYGARGRPGVPPYTPLLFEVELAEHRPVDR